MVSLIESIRRETDVKVFILIYKTTWTSSSSEINLYNLLTNLTPKFILFALNDQSFCLFPVSIQAQEETAELPNSENVTDLETSDQEEIEVIYIT